MATFGNVLSTTHLHPLPLRPSPIFLGGMLSLFYDNFLTFLGLYTENESKFVNLSAEINKMWKYFMAVIRGLYGLSIDEKTPLQKSYDTVPLRNVGYNLEP